jgi:CDP-diacylglycerol--glycerol-3-phosphate 3-phosphatidyltransferase
MLPTTNNGLDLSKANTDYKNSGMYKRIPWWLIYLRFSLTLPAISFAYYHLMGWPYVVLMLVAALSDYLDGVLARKWGVETASLRLWDSVADTIYFLGVLIGIWMSHPEVYAQYKLGIYSIVGLEILRYIVDLIKFKRGASYHAISAKIFGVCLLISIIAMMGWGIVYPLFGVTLVIGILSELEGLCMSFILDKWTYNVKHLGVALTLKKQGQS